jgi:hypothetical protein
MRSVLLYLVLVGTPFAGLLGILDIGERIEPPPSVGGTWALGEGSIRELGAWCPAIEFGDGPGELRVSQSGRYLALALSDRAGTSFSATLQRDSLAGGRFEVPDHGECRWEAVELRGRITNLDDEARLIGVLRPADCPGGPDCPAIDVDAVRQPTVSGTPRR